MPVVDAGVVTNDIIMAGRAEFYSIVIIGAIVISYYSVRHIAQIDSRVRSCMMGSMEITASDYEMGCRVADIYRCQHRAPIDVIVRNFIRIGCRTSPVPAFERCHFHQIRIVVD